MKYAWMMFTVALVATLMMPVFGQPLYRTIPGGSNGVPVSQITNTTANVAATSTTITPTVPSRRIVIKTDPLAAVVYVDLAGGTATTADFRIEPGAAFVYEGEPITSFNYIGASAAGTISVCAY